jgi:hypothetical protein
MKYNEDQLIVRLDKPFYIKNIDKNAPTETNINYEVIKQIANIPNIDVEIQLLNTQNKIVKIFKNYDSLNFDIEDFKDYINNGEYYIRVLANTIQSKYQLSRAHNANIITRPNRQPIISDVKNSKAIAKLFGKDYYYLILSVYNPDNDNLYTDIFIKDSNEEFTNQILEDYPGVLIQLAKYLDMNNVDPDSTLSLKLVLKDYRDYNNTHDKVIEIDTSFLSDIGNYYNEWLNNKYYADWSINKESFFANNFKQGMVFANDKYIINSFYYYNRNYYRKPFSYFIIYDKVNNELIKDDYYNNNVNVYNKLNNVYIFNDYIINNASYTIYYAKNINNVIRNGIITLIDNKINNIISKSPLSNSTDYGNVNIIYDELNYLFIPYDQNPYYFNFHDKNLYSINKNDYTYILDNDNFYLHPLFILCEQYKYMNNYKNNNFFWLGVELDNEKNIIFHNDNKIYIFNNNKDNYTLFENYYIDFFGSGLKDFFYFGAISNTIFYYVKLNDDRKYIIKYNISNESIENYIQLIYEFKWIYARILNNYITALSYNSNDNKNYLLIIDRNLNIAYLNNTPFNDETVLNPIRDDLDYNINRIIKLDDKHIYIPDFNWCINLDNMSGFDYSDYTNFFLDKDYHKDGPFYFYFSILNNKPLVEKYDENNNKELGNLLWTSNDLDSVMYLDPAANEIIYFKSPDQKIFIFFEFRGFDQSSYLQIFKDQVGTCDHIIYDMKKEIFDKLSTFKGLFLDKHRLQLQFKEPYLYIIFYPKDNINHEDTSNINEYLDKKFVVIKFDIYNKQMHQQII